MAFVQKIEFEEGIIGVWEITEDINLLVQKFQFLDSEKEEYDKFSSERRKKEFLAVRLLLQELLNKKPEIIHDDSGRGTLKNSGFNLSISHSKELAVVFLSKRKIGIDVENVERKIEKIAQRFLHKSEMDFVKSSANPQKAMVLLWCAKEAIFKCSEKQGIDFGREILVSPFSVDGTGVFKGKKIQSNRNIFYQLQHFNYKNNVVVFCVEDVEKS